MRTSAETRQGKRGGRFPAARAPEPRSSQARPRVPNRRNGAGREQREKEDERLRSERKREQAHCQNNSNNCLLVGSEL